MRNPNYLVLSRHNLFYFRFPLPAILHPKGSYSDIKLSLGTRCPREALYLGRCLVYLGGHLLTNPALATMEYIHLKHVLTEHFKAALQKKRDWINTNGRLKATDRAALENSAAFAAQALKDSDYFHVGTDDDLHHIVQKYELPLEPNSDKWEQLRRELVEVHKVYCNEVLKYDDSFETYNLTDNVITKPISVSTRLLADSIQEYLKEKENTKELEGKTLRATEAQLSLLNEYLGLDAGIDISIDLARDINMMLHQLPKHARSKPALKKMSIKELIGLERNHPLKQNNLMSKGSVIKYMNSYKSLFDWAVAAKYTSENNFSAIKVKVSGNEQARQAFTKEQIGKIVDVALVEEKPHYKWGALIGRYTGARLEEIAQMYVSDIQEIDNIWCFKFNDESDDKNIKTFAGNRIVPIHSRLIELGLLEYVSQMESEGRKRLLHQLSHTSNGYGRNLGRWFNNTLLPKLGLKTKALVFHSLRHTVTTELMREGTPLALTQDIIGHQREGVTMKVYAKNFKTSQLKDAVEKLGLWSE